ncbi:hypothetical protein BJX63DRAFT_431318 [Aspergillus granulosus]|uniref:C2H2-type domain-containing protein n=1 Tax=Aspergillus granulosus TaxID=176169 RepID=A0ABR4HHN1_9EURO
MSNEAGNLVLFIARASGASNGDTTRTKARLMESLDYTREAYEETYGPLVSGRFSSFVFIQGSNRSFQGQGKAVGTITGILERGKRENCPVMLVINGWDGLSTNPVALVNLFGPYIDQVQIWMRVFVGDPRFFRQVSVPHAMEVLAGDGDHEGDLDDLVLPYSTIEYIKKITLIRTIKWDIADDMAKLKAESTLRNTPPEIGEKLVCPTCGETFQNSRCLNSHKHHVHPDPDTENDRTCPHCQVAFARTDGLARHLADAICKENPNHVEKPPTKRAPRGSKSKTARHEEESGNSDGSYPSYYQIPMNTPNFPRVDPSAPFEERTVYRGEVFCRYPNCNSTRKFSEPTKLRTHYKGHGFEYPAQPRSNPTGARRKFEEDGLKFLARCAHYGSNRIDLVGPQPMRGVKRARDTDGVEEDDNAIREEGPVHKAVRVAL